MTTSNSINVNPRAFFFMAPLSHKHRFLAFGGLLFIGGELRAGEIGLCLSVCRQLAVYGLWLACAGVFSGYRPGQHPNVS
jgi:hypothetical protein